MSFNSFRADLISRLNQRVCGEQLDVVLNVMDEMSSSWEFSNKQTSLIVSDGLPDVVRLYIASKSVENVARGTLDGYLATLKLFFSTVHRQVQDVTSSDVRLWLNWYKTSRKIADSTYEHKRIILNSFFEWCVDEDIINKSPMRHVKPIRCNDPERLPLSALELEKVRNSCNSLREKSIVDFLYSTAMRVAELRDMNINDVDFIEHTVHIRCGKGGKGRTSYLNPEAEISLKSYLASRQDNNSALFVTSRAPHGRMSIRAIEIEIDKIISRCDVSIKVTPHIFRHTAASIALQRGMPIDQVQRWLGHAKIQTTLRYAKTLNVDVKTSHSKYVA